MATLLLEDLLMMKPKQLCKLLCHVHQVHFYTHIQLQMLTLLTSLMVSTFTQIIIKKIHTDLHIQSFPLPL